MYARPDRETERTEGVDDGFSAPDRAGGSVERGEESIACCIDLASLGRPRLEAGLLDRFDRPRETREAHLVGSEGG